jgi:hypothetical protein
MCAQAVTPFHTAADLLKIYRQAQNQAQYLSDINDKVLAYNNVIRSCENSKFCRLDESVKRNQILFWTYNKIGDIFLHREQAAGAEDYVFALQYYQNALEFTRQAKERHETLEKIAAVYEALNDENGYRRTREQIAEEMEDPMKRQAFALLARQTDDKALEIQYLERALTYIPAEKVSPRAKCQNTLRLCRRLLELYTYKNDLANFERITALQNKTKELLN